ncbi:hypothetical protein BVI2075_470016 [Burkholderia vietnamiensis]|nr:hypothetical protein BVI2075_470016 [Burkholderia vietnamiensis]CAG9231439.1 hypothetical protein BVI1335_780010 [Burkholderia vietnamiensis]
MADVRARRAARRGRRVLRSRLRVRRVAHRRVDARAPARADGAALDLLGRADRLRAAPVDGLSGAVAGWPRRSTGSVVRCVIERAPCARPAGQALRRPAWRRAQIL